MRARRRHLLAALVLATLVPRRARADETPPDATREPPAEVRVIGDRADALQRTPGSGTLVGSKDLARAAPVDVTEMLRRVPGVQVRQDFAGGNRLDISIRGLDGGRSRRVLVLEDGVPVALNPYSEPDMYYAPPVERMRGIEVVKGSGNILFGPQTLAGTLNFLTIAPPDRPTAVADLDVGTYGYARGLVRYGDSVGGVRYVVQALHRRGDGFRGLPFDSTNLLAKVAIPTGSRGEAVVKLGFHKDDAASDDVGLTAPMYAATPRRESLSPSSHSLLERYDVSVIHEERFSPETKLKTLAYAYRTDRVWRRQEYSRVATPEARYRRIVGEGTAGGAIFFEDANTVLDRQHDVLGFEPRLEHRFRTGSVGHTLDVGGRVLRESAYYQQRSGDYPETYAGSLDAVERRYGTAFAGYAQDRIAFLENLLVTPGIRFEHLAMRRVTLRQDTGAGPADVYLPGESSVAGIIPGIGMIYGDKTAHVFGGLHLGFAPPRVTSAITARGQTTQVSGDESINYELGTRLAGKWARVEATGFLSNFQNQVIVNTVPGADAVLADAGATNIVGTEEALLVRIDKLVRLPALVELGARYTYARSTFRYGANAGNFLPYAPEHSLNGNLDVEHGFTGGTVGGQLAYAFVGRQFADAANTVAEDVTGRIGEIGARHIVDATVHYKHARSGLSLRLTGKNVFDETYVISRRPEGIFTGPYRQLLLGVRWEWEGRARD